MKSIFLVIFLFVATLSFGQVTVPAGVGYESHLDIKSGERSYHPVFFLNPQYNVYGDLTLGAYALTVMGDSLPDFYAGLNATYPVWISADSKNTLSIEASYEQGTKGSRRYGGGLDYGISKTVAVSLTAGQIYNSKQVYAGLNLKYFFIK